jgi:transcription initiation factor TFIIIB Brf1 subunit/transcription initiation factor TFIIB
MKTAYDPKQDMLRTLRYVNNGRLPTRWYRLANHLYEWHEKSVWDGRERAAKRPGVVASCVYVAGNTLNMRVRQADCAAACKISEPTLRKIAERLWVEAYEWVQK